MIRKSNLELFHSILKPQILAFLFNLLHDVKCDLFVYTKTFAMVSMKQGNSHQKLCFSNFQNVCGTRFLAGQVIFLFVKKYSFCHLANLHRNTPIYCLYSQIVYLIEDLKISTVFL